MHVGDVVIGLVVGPPAERIAVPGEVFGLGMMAFVGLALVAVGLIGFGPFEALARKAGASRARPQR